MQEPAFERRSGAGKGGRRHSPPSDRAGGDIASDSEPPPLEEVEDTEGDNLKVIATDRSKLMELEIAFEDKVLQ